MNYIGTPPVPGGMILVGDTNPVGLIGWFHSPPDASYLRLNGQVVSKTTYAALWAYAQPFLTADQVANPGLYRSVDANTFAVPKLDGLFIRAQGTFDANRVSAALGVLQNDDNKSHFHWWGNNPNAGGAAGAGAAGWSNANNIATSNTGGTEARPANVALIPCVKALPSILMAASAFDLPGRLLQAPQHYRTDFFTSGATTTPIDDTIPQITEGGELFTLTMTPLKLGSTIRIRTEFVFAIGAASAAGVVAIHKAGQNDALGARIFLPPTTDFDTLAVVEVSEVVSALTARTYSVRGGTGTGAGLKVNGRSARLLGGAYSAFLRAEEYSA